MVKAQSSPSLLFCIIMDAVGCLSYLFPGVGEVIDVVWAPVSAFVFARAFGGTKGTIGGLFNFTEEILPGADFIPSFTIMWVMINKFHWFQKKKDIIIPVQSR